jgi:branched-chain amino acid transport system substrate-binding protein
VGILEAETGPLALFGVPAKEGALTVIDMVNKAGGIQGRKIQTVEYDNESSVDRSSALAKKLIDDDKVVAIIGPMGVPQALAAASVAAEKGVPIWADYGARVFFKIVVPDAVKPWIFFTGSGGDTNPEGFLPYFKSVGLKRIGMLAISGAIYDPLVGYVEELAEKYGLTMVGVERQEGTDRDFKPSLVKIKSAGVDALIIMASGPMPLISMDNAIEIGLDVPMGVISQVVIPETLETVSEAAAKNMVVALSPIAAWWDLKKGDPVTGKVMEFVSAYEAKYGNPERGANWASGKGATRAQSLMEALKVAGPDPAKIRDQVENGQKGLIGYNGMIYNRTPDDHFGVDAKDTIVVRPENRKFRLVTYTKDLEIVK